MENDFVCRDVPMPRGYVRWVPLEGDKWPERFLSRRRNEGPQWYAMDGEQFGKVSPTVTFLNAAYAGNYQLAVRPEFLPKQTFRHWWRWFLTEVPPVYFVVRWWWRVRDTPFMLGTMGVLFYFFVYAVMIGIGILLRWLLSFPVRQ